MLTHWTIHSDQLILRNISADFTHRLSHQTIYARFFTLETATPLNIPAYTIQEIRYKDLSTYPFYVLINRFLATTELKK